MKERTRTAEIEGLLAAISDSSTDAIISKSMEGVILSWNAAAQYLFGYSAAEAIGKHISLIIPSDRQQEEQHILDQLRAGKTVKQLETCRTAKDGRRVDIALTVSPIRAASDVIIGAVKVARDIRERREAEKAREQLRHAQKMEALGQLTGGIAHDFNNLLAVILGNLDFLRERTGEDDPLREFITPAIEAAEHGSELTQRLLAFGRKQTLQPQTIPVNELITCFAPWVRRILGERIEVVMSLSRELWPVHIDPGQLQDVLLNLSVNARDAMPDGGKLIYETSNVHLDETYTANNEDIVPGEYIMIAVSDTGTGMTAETIEKAFEPFFTTKEVGKGSGLGLSMAYGFVKQSAGHIKLYSEPGHGTSVKIYLPRAESTLSPLPRKAVHIPISAEKTAKNILVVEDNKNVLKLTASIVKSLGYGVIVAETGDAAMKILESRNDIDLLLTDVMLPGTVNGPTLAKRAARLHPDLKVLFNSGYAEHAISQNGMLEEGVHFISKPFRKSQLVGKLAELLK